MKKIRSTKNINRAISLCLSFLLAFGSFFTVNVIPVFAEDTEEEVTHYYESGTNTKYIKAIATCYSGSESSAKEYITSCTDTYLKKDLNDTAGGDYVYLGWTTTTDPTEAITGVRVKMYDSEPSSLGPITDSDGIVWYPVNTGIHSWVPKLHSDGCVDLNEDAGGTYIYVYITKDTRHGPPLYTIVSSLSNTKDTQGYYPVTDMDSPTACRNINYGTDGTAIYLFTETTYLPLDLTELRSRINTAEVYLARKKYSETSTTALTTAHDEAVALNEQIIAEGVVTTVSIYDVNNASDAITTALNNLSVTITLDAETNGGDPGQNTSFDVSLGRSASVTVSLADYTARKSDGYFSGWLSTPNTYSTTTIDSVQVSGNTTFYAIFRRYNYITLHYLKSESEYGSYTYTLQFQNNETTSANSIKLTSSVYVPDGYVHEGFRLDTLALPATIPCDTQLSYEDKDGAAAYPIYSKKPTITVISDFNDDAVYEGETVYLNTAEDFDSQSKSTTTITPEYVAVDHYIFEGYSLTEGGEVEYEPNTSFDIHDNLTLYAVYTPVEYKVTFLGINDAVIDEQDVPYGSSAIAPDIGDFYYIDNDEESHLTFSGWNGSFENICADTVVLAVYETVSHAESGVCDCGGVRFNEQNFPDDNFRYHLNEFIGFNTDNFLTKSEIKNTTTISIMDCDLTDVTGIEFFPDVVYIDFSENLIEEIDLSSLTKLRALDVGYNKLTSLKLYEMPYLYSLHCTANDISEIDVSSCSNLRILFCEMNELTEIDLSGNPLLSSLYVESNQLTELDLSNNTELQILCCSDNCLTSLDIGHLQKLDSSKLYVSTQRVFATLDCTETLDLTSFGGNLDASKVSISTSGVTKDGSVITVPQDVSRVVYNYDSGIEGSPMTVFVEITHTHGSQSFVANQVDPTCSASGYTGDTYCSICKEIYKKGEIIPTTAHAMDNGICTACPYANRIVYFDNVNSDWENVGVYCWDDSGAYVVANADWPGEAAEQSPYGFYEYKITSAGGTALLSSYYTHYSMIIFNSFEASGASQTADLKLYCCGIYTSMGFTGNYKHTFVDGECSYCGEFEELRESSDAVIDLDNQIVFTQKTLIDDPLTLFISGTKRIDDIFPSYENSKVTHYGTGSQFIVNVGNGYLTSYYLVVEGDLNGDSVCDVLDIAEASHYSQGKASSTHIQRYAAKGYSSSVDEEITVEDYSQIVNKALSS